MDAIISLPEVEIEDLVVKAVEKVFSTMLSVEAKFENSYPLAYDETSKRQRPVLDTKEHLVVSAVGFIGTINGVLYLHMEDSLARMLTCRMLDMDETDLDGDGYETVNDVLGELANMIAGTFKNQLCDMGHNCRMTIPSIMRGNQFTIETPTDVMRRIFQFTVNGAIFMGDLVIKMGA